MKIYYRTGPRSGVSLGPVTVLVLSVVVASLVFVYLFLALIAVGLVAACMFINDKRKGRHADDG